MTTPAPASELSCEEVVRVIWDYLDEELDDARRLQIRGHLAECEHCAGQATFAGAFLRRVRSVIDSPSDTEPLRLRILASLARQQAPSG